MKAVLVVCIPDCICTYCPIYNMGDLNDDYRGEWCSEKCLLKPLPDNDPDCRFFDECEVAYKEGWNDCLKKIVGE